MAQTTDQRSPEEIEREIRATQEEMSRTARQIEGELSPRNIIDALLDKAGQSGVDSSYLIDTARRNPIALGMIALGGLWLVSDADARPSAIKMPLGGSRSKGSDQSGADGWHPEHRTYVEHMARCEPMAGEDDETYRRRRDRSRASYFMMEQGHDEDERTFRQRLDEATEAMRRRREHIGESARSLASSSRERGRHMMEDARGFYFDNPLMGGLAAAFVGAVAGSAVPATRTEESYVGRLGEQALDAAGAKARQAGEGVRHRKDDMLDRVENKLAGHADEDRQHTENLRTEQAQHDIQIGDGGSERPPRFADNA